MLTGIPQRFRVFLVCIGGIFTTVFDTSAAIVALPTIAADFGTDLPTIQWVIIGNSLAIAALLVPMGRLSDLIGRKRIYVLGCLAFGACSLIAATADSVLWLITARVLVGVGSAMTQGTAMALMIGSFGLDQRARMLGLQMAGVGLGAMAGPSLGGFVVGLAGWPALFLITGGGMLPIAVAAQFVLKPRAVRPAVQRPPFDLPGAMLFSGMLISALLTLTLGPGYGWHSPLTLAGIVTFAMLLAGFLAAERRHPAPMLDFSLFSRRDFALGTLSAVVAFMCISSMRFLAPFFFQAVKGFSPSGVGLLMLPAAVTMAVTGPFVGTIADRLGVRLVANVGFGIAMLGLATFAGIASSSSTVTVVASLVLMALGMASFSAPNSAAILNSVDDDAHGIGAGIVNLCRNTGNIIGIAFGTTVVTLSMGRAGFPATLAAVESTAGADLLSAFAGGIAVTAICLLVVGVATATLVVSWTVRGTRSRQ